jgi:hypothetical protein
MAGVFLEIVWANGAFASLDALPIQVSGFLGRFSGFLG